MSIFPIDRERRPALAAFVRAGHTAFVIVVFFYVIFFYVRSEVNARYFDASLRPSLEDTIQSVRQGADTDLFVRPAWLFLLFVALFAFSQFGKHHFATAIDYTKHVALTLASLGACFVVIIYANGSLSEHLSNTYLLGGASAAVLVVLWFIQGVAGDLLGGAETATVRGRDLLPFALVKKRVALLTPPLGWFKPRDRRTRYFFGGVLLPEARLRERPHFAIVGTTGSGKTLSIKMLIRAALSPRDGVLPNRGVVFDPKGEMYPFLRSCGIEEGAITVLNPFDERSSAWDIASDVTTFSDADQMASILCPVEAQGDNKYFDETASAIVRDVLQGFHAKAPRAWTLNDVVEAAASPRHIQSLLALTHDGSQTRERLFGSERDSSADVVSTAATKLGRFRTIARLWARSKGRPLSLKEWSNGSGILLIGQAQTLSEPLQAINRALMRRVNELLCEKPENPPDHTWVFLDEASATGRVDGLDQLQQRGRSKGVHVVLGFQSILGFRKTYSHDADHIFGLCDNQAMLRLSDAESAEWASRQFGKYEYYQKSFGVSSGGGSGGFSDNHSENISLAQRELILPREFQEFPETSPRRGLTGAFSTPLIGSWVKRIPWRSLVRHLPPAPNTEANPGFIPRANRSDEDPLPWSDDDRRRLGLGNVERPDVLTEVKDAPPPDEGRRDRFGGLRRARG